MYTQAIIISTHIAQCADLLLLTVRSLLCSYSLFALKYHTLKSLAALHVRIKYVLFLKEDLSLYHLGDGEHEALI